MSAFQALLAEIYRICHRAHRYRRERGYRRNFGLPSDVRLGERFSIQGRPASPKSLVVGSGTELHGRVNFFGNRGILAVGKDCFVGENAVLWCALGIEIGDRCLLSHGVNVHDTDSHPLAAEIRARQIVRNAEDLQEAEVLSDHVVLGDDVWVGFNAILLKGVHLGKGCVVGAGSVVTRSFPPFSLLVGNPARLIRTIPSK
jgi:maltose O-acetyltransferase